MGQLSKSGSGLISETLVSLLRSKIGATAKYKIGNRDFFLETVLSNAKR